MTATDLPGLDEAIGTDAGPAIGRRAPDATRADIKPFTLYSYDRDGSETPHHMRARPDELDYPTLLAFIGKGVNEIQRLEALHFGLRKVLCDDDGVRCDATVTAVVDRDGAWTAVADLPDGDDVEIEEIRFTVDGDQIFDDADSARSDAIERGSTLRRYDHLMDPTTPSIVDNDAPAGIVRYLLSGGGGPRPTKSSRASSGSRRTKKTRSGAG